MVFPLTSTRQGDSCVKERQGGAIEGTRNVLQDKGKVSLRKIDQTRRELRRGLGRASARPIRVSSTTFATAKTTGKLPSSFGLREQRTGRGTAYWLRAPNIGVSLKKGQSGNGPDTPNIITKEEGERLKTGEAKVGTATAEKPV